MLSKWSIHTCYVESVFTVAQKNFDLCILFINFIKFLPVDWNYQLLTPTLVTLNKQILSCFSIFSILLYQWYYRLIIGSRLCFPFFSRYLFIFGSYYSHRSHTCERLSWFLSLIFGHFNLIPIVLYVWFSNIRSF